MPDTKITALTALTAADPANDVLPIVDVSDTTMAASGTTKKISINNVLGCSGTATLASATITGNLTAAAVIPSGSTVPTNGLYLPTANNLGFAYNSTLGMTLNSTGLGVGVSPAYKLDVGGSSAGVLRLVNINNSSTDPAAVTRLSLDSQGATWHLDNERTSGIFKITRNSTTFLTIDNSGNLILQPSATPATLTTNGQLTVNATSNTNLRFSYRGSDGVTRVANLTLA